MKPTNRAIIVGCGSIGLRHARVIREAGWTSEICDIRPDGLKEAQSQFPDIRCWDNFSKALDSNPQAIIVATPPSMHAEISIAALDRNISVLCEKPMSDSIESSRKMSEAAQRSKGILRIGFVGRFFPSIAKLHTLCHAGELGTPLSYRYCVGAYETLINSRSHYQQHTKHALVLDYVHGLDLLLWFAANQKATGVYARGITGGNLEFSAYPNLVSAIFDYEESLLSEIRIDYVGGPTYGYFEVIGDRQSVIAHYDGRLEFRNRITNKREDLKFQFERNDTFHSQWKAFTTTLAGNLETTACDAKSGLASTILMHAMMDSLDSGNRVVIPL